METGETVVKAHMKARRENVKCANLYCDNSSAVFRAKFTKVVFTDADSVIETLPLF